MKHARYLLTLVGLLSLVTVPQAQEPSCNPTNLPLQLGQLAAAHPIDGCRCIGAPKGEADSQIRIANDFQNSIKNNFMRSTNNPKAVSIADLARLQERVNAFSMEELPRGDRFTLPSPDQRTLLGNISLGPNRTFSEGDVVTIAGFVLGARHSNLEDGESVNCEKPGCANNDVHIELAAHRRDPNITKAKQMNTEGVDVEISPRHRPDAWDRFDSSSYINFFKTHPVAFTGQLFYDASHSPGGGPVRVSVWEVHPIYAIWVCRKTTLQACALDQLANESVWLPFHKLQSFLHLQTVQVTEACQENP
jgi:hypothetical protein